MSIVGNSIRSKTNCRRRWLYCLLAALGSTATANSRALADPGSAAQTLQAGPVHTSVAVEEPRVRQRLIPTQLIPAEAPSNVRMGVPVAAELPTTELSATVLPAAVLPAPPRRELWAQSVVSARPVADQAATVQRVAQAPARRALPVPEDVSGRPIGNLPYDDDIRPLSAARNHLQPAPGEMPMDYAQAQFEAEQPVVGGSASDRRPTGVVYLYEASALCFQPIYIEDVNLERYGYTHGILQPFVSAVHFFGTIPLLPYKMGMHPESECVYALGYYRPGTPAPYQTSRLGWSWRGAICEATAIGAFIAWIPSGKFY